MKMKTMNFLTAIVCVVQVMMVGCEAGLKIGNTSDDDNSNQSVKASVSIAGQEKVSVGKQIVLTATRTPVDSSVAFAWTTSDESVATVASGVVKGISEGVAVITVVTAEANPVSATKSITVTSASSNDGDTSIADIDYTSYVSGNKSITVRNNTSKKLVAFKGSPRTENLISGIPANATNHGLKFVRELFKESRDFVLFLVTEEDYLANINDLSRLDNVPFTRLYAYYNTNASNNNMIYEISSKVGGECAIILNNDTVYNVELRQNGLYGETIGYTGQRTLQTTFSVDAGDYYIYPVFRRFDSSSGEIITAFPKYTQGQSAGQSIRKRFSLDSNYKTVEFNAQDWVSGVKFVPSAAYIRISNNSTSGISFYSGSTSSPELTSTGGKLINSGRTMTFEVHMESNGNNGEYSESVSKSQYCVGSADTTRIYITTGGTSSSVNFKFYAGKIYDVSVNGDDLNLTVDTSWMDTSSDATF